MSTLSKVLVGAAPVIAVLVAAAFFIPPDFPYLARQVLLFAWAACGIFIAERLLFGPGLDRIVTAMGLVAPRRRAVAIALVASVPMWAFLPIFGAATGRPAAISPNWLAILAGVILVNGIAEELIHRAFVFGHLRRDRSFTAAAWISAAVFAAQHIYLIFTIGPVPGGASVLLALCLAFPLALLYERGGNSLAGPAILHTSSNAPMMIFGTAELAAAALLPHMVVVLVSMYSSFVLVRFLDRP